MYYKIKHQIIDLYTFISKCIKFLYKKKIIDVISIFIFSNRIEIIFTNGLLNLKLGKFENKKLNICVPYLYYYHFVPT